MNKIIAIVYFVLSLYGCNVGESTFIDRSDSLYSRVVAQAGVARFECLRSSSGSCHYTVFPRKCAAPPARASAPAAMPSDRCQPQPLDRFTIAAGDSRLVPGLHGFRPCVSTQEATAGPDCDSPARVAAR